MDLVTFTNMFSEVPQNLREALLTNTSTTPVSPSFSKNTSIPVIVYSVDAEEGQPTFEKGKLIWRADISCVHGTVTGVSSLAQDVYTIINTTYRNTFENANMYVIGKPIISSSGIERNGSRFHVRTITVSFLVEE